MISRHLAINHEANEAVKFTIEVEPVGHGPWMIYKEVVLDPGEVYQHEFPEAFQARWIRFTTDKDCEATTWLEYR